MVRCSAVICTWVEMEVGRDKSRWSGIVWGGCMKIWVG